MRWADEPGPGEGSCRSLPETWLLAALAYFIGLGLGWLLWGRRRREGFV